MIVLEPPAPVESAPFPYSTKNEPFAFVTESGEFDPSEGVWKVLTAPICGDGGAFLSATKVTPCGEPNVKPGAFSAAISAVKAPVVLSTWPKAARKSVLRALLKIF